MSKPVRIKTGDIYIAFVKFLKTYFPDIDIMNVVKDNPRPAFFPKLEVTEVNRATANHIDSDNIMRLYYFPSTHENTMVELANMQDELTMALWGHQDGLIEINGVNIEFYDVAFHRVEDVLHCYVFMSIGHGIIKDESDVPNMENLYPNIEAYERRYSTFGDGSDLGYLLPMTRPLYPKVGASPNIILEKKIDEGNYK